MTNLRFCLWGMTVHELKTVSAFIVLILLFFNGCTGQGKWPSIVPLQVNRNFPKALDTTQQNDLLAELEDDDIDRPPCPLPLRSKARPSEIYFLHVPKAGGSAFVLVLLHFMGPRMLRVGKNCYNVVPGTPRPCNVTTGDKDCRSVLNCVDHLHTIGNLKLPNTPSIAMIRNPIGRLLSGWNYFWPHRPRHTENMTFAGYVESPYYQHILAKMFSGIGYPYHARAPTPEDFEVARRNILRFTFVGLQEAFVTSVKLFFALMGQPPLPADSIYFQPAELERDVKLGHGVRINGAQAYVQFKKQLYRNATAIRHLQKLNHYDMALYHVAVQAFCHKVSLFPCLLTEPVVQRELNRPTLCEHLFNNNKK